MKYEFILFDADDTLFDFQKTAEKCFSETCKKLGVPYKEGYYQNLIGRRYTFLNNDDDSFIIIDKELVIGFENTTIKKEWNESIVGQTDGVITKVRTEIKSLPKDIKNSYGEFVISQAGKNGKFPPPPRKNAAKLL